MVYILLLCPKLLYNLQDDFEGPDYLLEGASTKPLCLLIGLNVGVDVGGGKVLVEGSFDGVNELPTVGWVEWERRNDINFILLFPHYNI